MATGLADSYGTIFAMAGRYLFPSDSNRAWMFVADAAGVEPGASIPFESPTGVRIAITHRSDTDENNFNRIEQGCGDRDVRTACKSRY
jgi:hypothetical protein